MPNPEDPIEPPKTKRTRKPKANRAPRVKDPGILAIEQAAAKQKAAYRQAQQSGGVLTRILKLVARLVPEDKNKLADSLKLVATPALPLE